MKIGINTFFFKYPASGSGQYLLHLLQSLAEVDQENQYILLGPHPMPQKGAILTQFPQVVTPVPTFAARNESIEKLMWEQLTAPAAASKAGVDLFHIPYFAPPFFSRTPGVITIHDVIPLRLPIYRTSPKMKAYLRLIARAAHKAALIITVSQHAKQGYGLHEGYILYVGGLDQRKNVPQLVRAFAHLYQQFHDPDLQLLIAGNPDKQSGALYPDPRPVAANLGMSGQIIYRFIEEEDKPAIYSGANIFIFPSLYEGFGLTPLEAMSCGAPVICSNRTSLPEVVGDAAISLDPDDIHKMVEAMRNVLMDNELRADLRTRSLKRAAQFSWRKAAAQTIAVYQEAFVRSKR